MANTRLGKRSKTDCFYGGRSGALGRNYQSVEYESRQEDECIFLWISHENIRITC